jgi:NAD(P)-dependent dehydrogenase (short-subunit alcohol dehydrogenase family)
MGGRPRSVRSHTKRDPDQEVDLAWIEAIRRKEMARIFITGSSEGTSRRWQGSTAYAESKLLDVLLAFAIARRWTNVLSNALEPGWVPTRMGGPWGAG